MRPREIAAQAAYDLNDIINGVAFVHYPEQSIYYYINEAVRVIASFCPQDLLTTKVVKLIAGAEQNAPDMVSVSQVLYLCDKDGNQIGNQIRPLSSSLIARWTSSIKRPECKAYQPTGYFIRGTRGSFVIQPPVPADMSGKLYVKVVGQAEITDLSKESDTDLSGAAAPAIMQWVLYRAMAVDDESASSAAAAQRHLQQFFVLCRIKATAETIQRVGDITSLDATRQLQILRSLGAIGITGTGAA